MASKEKELILNEEEDILLFMLLRRNRAKKKFSNRKRKVWVRHVYRRRRRLPTAPKASNSGPNVVSLKPRSDINVEVTSIAKSLLLCSIEVQVVSHQGG